MSKSAPKRPAEEDIDSLMQDTSPTSGTASRPTTPPNQQTTLPSDALSPPDSQPQTANPPNVPRKKDMPLNANGKRTLETAKSGLVSISAEGVKDDSGYKWEREEDAPGYAWLSVKGREEAMRAWTQVVDKDRRIGNKYGDVLLK